jgi:hypothetical protein
MGKRFESSTAASLNDMVRAYQIFGITDLIGYEGENTAFRFGDGNHGDHATFYTLPGKFNADEVQELLSFAFSGTTSVAEESLAA